MSQAKYYSMSFEQGTYNTAHGKVIEPIHSNTPLCQFSLDQKSQATYQLSDYLQMVKIAVQNSPGSMHQMEDWTSQQSVSIQNPDGKEIFSVNGDTLHQVFSQDFEPSFQAVVQTENQTTFLPPYDTESFHRDDFWTDALSQVDLASLPEETTVLETELSYPSSLVYPGEDGMLVSGASAYLDDSILQNTQETNTVMEKKPLRNIPEYREMTTKIPHQTQDVAFSQDSEMSQSISEIGRQAKSHAPQKESSAQVKNQERNS